MQRLTVLIVVIGALIFGGYTYYAKQKASELAAEQASMAAEATAAATKAAEEAAAAEAAKAAEAATAAATAATTAAATAAAGTSVEDQLKVENFDMATVSGLIDATAISAEEKATLKTALENAKNSPTMLAVVLERVRAVVAP